MCVSFNKMWEWLGVGVSEKPLVSKKPLPEKDPDDFRLCPSSTPWQIDRYHCAKCKCSTSHQEYMSGACNQCGTFDTQELSNRSHRKIWYKGKWQFQVRTNVRRKKENPHHVLLSKYSTKMEIIEKWYTIIKD